jgi:hypothetical protein
MKIKLSSIKSIIISIPENPPILEELNRLNYEDVSVFPAYTSGPGKPNNLSYSQFSVIKNNESNFPIIIFEDDAMPINYIDEIEVPDDADIVYLGIISGHNFLDPLIDPVNGLIDVYRIHGALGTHAVLYLSERVITPVKRALAKAFAGMGSPHCDEAINTINSRFNIYAINPVFYQHNPKNVFLSNLTRIKSLKTMERDPIF